EAGAGDVQVVHGGGDGRRQVVELDEVLGQDLVGDGQQPVDLPAGHRQLAASGPVDRDGDPVEAEGTQRRVGGGGHRQPLDDALADEVVAVDVDAGRAVEAGDHRDVDQLGQSVDEPCLLVDQLVGLAAGCLGRHDRLVEGGDPLGEVVDL